MKVPLHPRARKLGRWRPGGRNADGGIRLASAPHFRGNRREGAPSPTRQKTGAVATWCLTRTGASAWRPPHIFEANPAVAASRRADLPFDHGSSNCCAAGADHKNRWSTPRGLAASRRELPDLGSKHQLRGNLELPRCSAAGGAGIHQRRDAPQTRWGRNIGQRIPVLRPVQQIETLATQFDPQPLMERNAGCSEVSICQRAGPRNALRPRLPQVSGAGTAKAAGLIH